MVTKEEIERSDRLAQFQFGGVPEEERPKIPSPKLEPLPREPVEDFRGALERLYPEMFDPAAGLGIREEDIPDAVWETVSTWSQEDPEGFIEDLLLRGNPEDAEILLGAFGASLDEIEEIITPTETGWRAAWNKLVTGAYRFAFQTRDYFVTILPKVLFPEELAEQDIETFALKTGVSVEEAEAKLGEWRIKQRDTFRQLSTENREQYEEWVAKHPELRPPPEWEGEILPLLKDDPTLILDPAFIAFIAADSAAFMAAFWGATATVGFATKNPILGMAAGVAITTPAQSQDLYEDLLWAGAKERQAAELAVPVGLLIASVEMLGGLAVLRAVGAMPGLRPFYQLFRKNLNRQVAKGILGTMARRGLTSFTEIEIAEIFEEILQSAIQNALVKTFDESRAVLEGITETVLRTFISVFPLALIGGGANTVVTYRQMTREQRNKVEAEQAKMEDAGLPSEQAEMIAMTDFAQTPEGQEVIDRATEEVTAVPEVGIPEVAKPVGELDEMLSAKHPQVDAFVYERPDSIRLQSISVPKELQRQGLGTAYMQDLVDYADEVGKTITLSTGGRGFDFPKAKLIDYYKRFGFVENKGRNLDLRISDTMYRKPIAKPPVVKVPEPEIPEIIGERGIPVPPEETISRGVEDVSPLIKDIGLKEEGRPTRKVFEKMGLYTTWKGIQKAEVEIGESRQATLKALRKVFKPIDKARRVLVFREVNEKGSIVGLTFDEKRAVTWYRKWADDWANRKNLPQEKRIKDYIPHLFEQEMTTQLKENNQISPELSSILSEKVQKKITDPFLKERLGAVGFLEDPMAAVMAYEAVALRVLYYEPFLQKIASVANTPTTPPLIRGYLKNYSRRMTGEPSKFDTALNNSWAEFVSVLRPLPGGERLVATLTQGNAAGLAAYNYTSIIYSLWLGFKPTSAIRNLSQHTLIMGEVGPIHFANGLRLRFTKEGKVVLAKSLVVRSRRAAFIPGIDDSFIDGWSDDFREAALYMFRLADLQNVSDAFLAGYSEAKSLLPDAGEQLWIERGDEVAADTQYLYTKMNSMAVSQSAVGRVFSILTTWMENWMELMTKWVSRRPSQVYLQYEKETGTKLPKKNWSQTYKAITLYMMIIALGFLIKEETRLKAWEYTGITSIRYLADIIGGDFPGLQAPGAVANIVAGFITDDERRLKSGWADMKGTFTPSIIRQGQSVALGEKDWLTLLFYLEGKSIEITRLKDKWEKELKVYNELPLKERKQYREDNPKIEAQLFVVSQISTLSTDVARAEVLLLIAKHELDSELIDGYAKVFAKDGKVELERFEDRLGNLEKLTVGEEAEYFMTTDYASAVNRLVKTLGRTAVGENGSPLTVEYLGAKDNFVQYDILDADGRKQLRQQIPELEAQLYLWGRIQTFENPNSAVVLLDLMKKHNLPPESIPAFVDDPAKYDELQTPLFDLKLKLFGMEETDPQFETVTRRIEAFDRDIPETLHDDYVGYYTIPSAGYDNERFLMEHEAFYRYMVDSGAWQEKDFSKVPTVKFEEMLADYEKLEIGTERYAFRGNNPAFDEEGVRLGKWKSYKEPTEKPEPPPKAPPKPKVTKVEKEPEEDLTFREEMEKREREFQEALKRLG